MAAPTASEHPAVLQRLASLALRIDRRYLRCILEFSLTYWVFTLLHSMRRMWSDELHTFYISRLPSIGMIWAALKDGSDFNPPPLYWATRIAHKLFGESATVTRLPQMMGFWVLCLCLFCFVSRRCGRVYGLCAMVFPCLTMAYGYASEARAYGIILAFCGVALVCWQRATEESSHRFWLIAYSLALTGALSTHAYGVLLLIPFAIGELARTWRSRKTDIPVWVATLLPTLSLIVYVPLTKALRPFTLGGPAFRPEASSVISCYVFLLGQALWVVIAALLVPVFLSRLDSRRDSQAASEPGLRFHEIACTVGLALIPVFGVMMSFATKAPFVNRYGLMAVSGMAILLVAIVGMPSRFSPVAAAPLFIILGGSFLGGFGASLLGAYFGHASAPILPAFQLSDVSSDLPIVLSNGLMFMEASHYERADVMSRTYYLLSRPAALAYTGSDVFEQEFKRAQRWFPMHGNLVDYADFKAAHPRFLVFGPFAYPNDWLMRKLADDGSTFVLKGEYASGYGDCLLLEVTSR